MCSPDSRPEAGAEKARRLGLASLGLPAGAWTWALFGWPVGWLAGWHRDGAQAATSSPRGQLAACHDLLVKLPNFSHLARRDSNNGAIGH